MYGRSTHQNPANLLSHLKIYATEIKNIARNISPCDTSLLQNSDRHFYSVPVWADDSFRAGLVYGPQEGLMGKHLIRILVFAVFLAFLSSTCITGIVTAAQVETLMGTVVKQGKGFVIETDDGDYIVKGKDVSKFVGKLVEVTGIMTESNKGDIIEVKSIQELQDDY